MDYFHQQIKLQLSLIATIDYISKKIQISPVLLVLKKREIKNKKIEISVIL
jgi:hypothetical protein